MSFMTKLKVIAAPIVNIVIKTRNVPNYYSKSNTANVAHIRANVIVFVTKRKILIEFLSWRTSAIIREVIIKYMTLVNS